MKISKTFLCACNWFNDVKYAPIGMYKNGRTYSLSLNFKL